MKIIIICLIGLLIITGCSSYNDCFYDCMDLEMYQYNSSCNKHEWDTWSCYPNGTEYIVKSTCYEECKGGI